jgi:hypothetical protein
MRRTCFGFLFPRRLWRSEEFRNSWIEKAYLKRGNSFRCSLPYKWSYFVRSPERCCVFGKKIWTEDLLEYLLALVSATWPLFQSIYQTFGALLSLKFTFPLALRYKVVELQIYNLISLVRLAIQWDILFYRINESIWIHWMYVYMIWLIMIKPKLYVCTHFLLIIW